MTAYLVVAVAWPPACALAWSFQDRLLVLILPFMRRVLRRRGSRLEAFLADWAAAALLVAAVWGWNRLWLPAGVSVAGAVLAAVIRWWLRRRRRRPAGSLIGGRGKALRDALVRRMRQRTVPRPVLNPRRAS